MIPLTQTSIWADLNEHFNEVKAYKFTHGEISCLFGIDMQEQIITSFGGPVISAGVPQEHFEDFIRTLLRKIKHENLHQVNFRSLFPLRQWTDSYENVFIKLGFKKEEWKTFIIDLCPSEEQLFKNFQSAARKGIKKAQRLQVNIKKCVTFDDYYTNFLIPYLKTTNRSIREKLFYSQGWELDSASYYSYWVAENSEGKKLGFLGSYRYDGVAIEIMSALTPLAWQQKIPVQDLLHWEIIKYHKNLGDLYFDLAGFNPNPIAEKENNIKRFKEKWGGVEYDTSSYTLDRRSPVKKLFHKLLKKIHG